MNAPVKLRPDQPAEIVDPLALLRAPFPENQISKLPKPLAKRDEMDKLPKAKCAECGGYHATSKVIHLDYVGHAALTDRLLDADPHWSWEPVPDPVSLGLPTAPGGMWIKLTVAGVTRLGFGYPDGKTGGDAVKETIGDALRNAAMRFGAALDLWHKGDLHVSDDETETPKAPPPNRTTGATAPTPPTLEERATRLEAAMRSQKTEDALRKAYGLASSLRAELKAKDPVRLEKIEQLYDELLAPFAAPPKEDFGIDPQEIPF